jgi:UDP-N-acetylglucosamine 2-epimerase (non-hydrolysing)
VQKLKVMTVVGTRPEVIRLSRVMAALDRHLNQVIVHTGQNYDYELNHVFFEDLELRRPDHYLEAAGSSACETVGNVITRLDAVLEKECPDALLVLGDTNSCLAAYPAKRRKIPVFHMEAGNRCFDHRVPEEINRKIIDHISDINLPYSTIAREYLIREGLPPDRVIKTGSPMYEVIHYYYPKIQSSNVLKKMRLASEQYFVVSAHREENIDDSVQFEKYISVLNNISEKYGLRVIVSTHPRTRMRIEKEDISLNKKVELLKPLGFSDYVHLQIRAKATLSDSGTITEESSILNFPALNIRNVHERPEGMEEAAVMLTGLEPNRVMEGLAILESQHRGEDRMLSLVSDYKVPNVSEKIARIILSYTDYINRTVWHKG